MTNRIADWIESWAMTLIITSKEKGREDRGKEEGREDEKEETEDEVGEIEIEKKIRKSSIHFKYFKILII